MAGLPSARRCVSWYSSTFTSREPEEFRPERWERGLAKRIPKFAYYPFGGGQRICVGSTFALMEAAIILAAVGQRYRFTLDPDAVIGIKPQITLLPAIPVMQTTALNSHRKM